MVQRRNFLLAAGAGLMAGSARAQAPLSKDPAMADIAEDDSREKEGLALALGGGAAKAFAHIPYLESLDTLGIRPKEVAGTSMGSILGALYCDGMSGREIRDYVIDLFTRRQSLLKKLLIDTGDTWGSLINIFRPAVVEPEILFAALFPEGMARDFAGLEIPLTIVATDFYRQNEYVMREGPLLSAIAASSCLPVLLTPVRRDGRVLIDGGFVNPTPFDLLDKARYFTVAIDVTGTDVEDTGEIPGSFETWAGSFSITQRSIVAEKVKCARPDIFIEPAVGGFNPMDFFEVEDILAAAGSDQDAFKRRIEKIFN
ncbi:patatin-like phospholipase family protein [Martelella lutilitoris]|uniref:Patatin-like phospholipase family protein n=1 Tax=Martelella lutilitoris TaxID=2583532 RepID=A0A7T7KK13_9HYPH|nr:patatin-like phospholipase family protein [Martelella lutilitoris]QQM29151.1 patatin-like phospholipase family protein [Martelella lutilitoris]